MKKISPIMNIIIPTIAFWICYRLFGLLPAMIISILISLVTVLQAYTKKKQVSNTQIIGLVGLILSSISIVLSGNEKLYYIPALISNIVLLSFMVVLTIKRKSVFLYLAKDFQIKSLQHISEQDVLSLNYLWMCFFFLKCISKIAGLIYLDFEKMYWVVFFLGDPAMLIVVGISVIHIKRNVINVE